MARSLSGKSGALRVWSTFGGRVTGALVITGIAAWIVRASPARAGGDGATEAASQERPAISAERERFVAEVERRLKVCHERVAAVGATELAGIDEGSRIRDTLTNQQIATKSADANYRNATLAREIAEIAVREYEEGIFKQDDATLQGEVKLAESEAARAQDAVEFAKLRLAKIKEVSTGTAADVAVEYSYEDNALNAQRREPKARLAMEQAQFKLKLLREYTKPRTIKQLQAEVEKLRADEFAKKAVWESEKSKDRRLEERIASTARSESAARGLDALNRAFGIDEKIRVETGKIAKNGAIDQALAKIIAGLLDEFEGVVDQVEAEAAAARVDRLKAAIKQVSRVSGRSKP
jgi:hypothetical protein